MTIENTVNVSSMNISEHQRAVKLSEIGPRMELKLMKIQEGFCEGNVIYHSYMQKTKEQVKSNSTRIKKKVDDKLKRKTEQEANVEKKKKTKKKLRIQPVDGKSDKKEVEEEEESEDEHVSEDENYL